MATAYDLRVGSGGVAVVDQISNFAVMKATVNFATDNLANGDVAKVMNLPAGWVPIRFLYKVTAATDTATMTVDIGVWTTGTTVGTQLKDDANMKSAGWAGADPSVLPSTSNQVIAVLANQAITTGSLDIVVVAARVA